MNQKAKDLGLSNTNFVTPHGLDNDEHYTTPYELAILTDYALNNKTFREIVNTQFYTISINEYTKELKNTNELLGNLNGVNGVKTGFTNKAGRCLVTSTMRNNWEIICVVLGADTKKTRTKDSINLIEYTFKNYKLINIKKLIQEKFENEIQSYKDLIQIKDGKTKTLNLILNEIGAELYPIRINEEGDLKCNIDMVNYIKAPIKKGDILGSLEITSGENIIYNVDILVDNDILEKDLFDYFKLFLFNIGTYICNGRILE